MSASADDVEAALNDLWSIKPDSVTVTKQELGTKAQYTVTFDSRRGGWNCSNPSDSLTLCLVSH